MIPVARYEYEYEQKGSVARMALIGDPHIDSPHCERKALEGVLKNAVADERDIFIFGDLFDAMQNVHDKRASKSELKAEYKRDDYINRIIDDVFDFLKPYAARLKFLSYGNHETAIIKHSGVDIMQILAYKLKKSGADGLQIGGYAGFIRWQFRYKDMPTGFKSYVVYYNHGAGADAPMTDGILQMKRSTMWLPNADFIITGHNHADFIHPVTKMYLNQKDIVEFRTTELIKLGTFKLEHDSGFGFMVERMGAPKTISATNINFDCVYRGKNRDITYNIITERLKGGQTWN